MRVRVPRLAGLTAAVILTACAPVLTKESVRSVVAGARADGPCQTYECHGELIRAFILRTATVQIGTTRFEDLSNLGLDPRGANVGVHPGAQGRKWILGTDNVQIQLSAPSQTAEYLAEDSRYLTVVYPLLNTRKIEDRIYFSEHASRREGAELTYVVILYDGLVKRSFFVGVETLDEREVRRAFGQGVVEILRGLREFYPR